jgi:hypothetical protein
MVRRSFALIRPAHHRRSFLGSKAKNSSKRAGKVIFRLFGNPPNFGSGAAGQKESPTEEIR